MKRITVGFLKRHKACDSQVRKFAKVFPSGAPVSLRSLEEAEKAGIDWRWLESFGDAEYEKARSTIYAAYEKALAPVDAEYEKARSTIYAEYEKARAPIYAEYEKARAPIYAEYEKARAPIYAEYEKARAPILIAALLRYKEE